MSMNPNDSTSERRANVQDIDDLMFIFGQDWSDLLPVPAVAVLFDFECDQPDDCAWCTPAAVDWEGFGMQCHPYHSEDCGV